VTGDISKDLTLFDKLKLYPEIVLDETLGKVRGDLKILLEKVNNPGEDDNPGLALEELAKTFLESPYLKFNRARRICETGEIDLDFTVRRFETTLFCEFSYPLIVECKNWSKKAGTPELRIFCSKMHDVRTNIGIFFSKQGITRDAKGVIRNAWLQDGIVVLTFDAKDLDQIINHSRNLYEVFHEKYLAVRMASKE
jgi:Holliday junction resolvase-like predicted endonuclease